MRDVYREICSEKTLQSNANGFFMTFADCVEEHVGKDWIKHFGKLSDDKKRIRAVFREKATKEALQNFLDNVKEVYRPKNAEFSQRKRAEAEKLSKQGEHQKALLFFSQSVLRAPKSELALSLWGRSQTLMKLNKFSLALSDIQLALKSNLPDACKASAFWNMGVCHEAIGEANKAKIAFQLAEKLSANDKNGIQSFQKGQKVNFVEESRTVVLKSVPSSFEKLSVKQSKELGRYVVANKQILTGETLVVEEPYAACLLPEMFGTHCHNCFKRLESAIGCTECSSVAFCSSDCRDDALSTYHKYECRYLDLLIGSGMSILSHTALRMVTQHGFDKCLEIYNNRDKEQIYQLCTNASMRKPADFLQRTLMAAFMLKCLRESGFSTKSNDQQPFPTECELRIGEMLLYNLQMLQFNAHEIYETVYSTERRIKNSKTLYIGVAVYPTASLLNHECHPGVTRHFEGKNIVLTSARPLGINEIVPENYGPVFTRKTLHERQKYLSGRYWFDCQCLACRQNWPGLKNGLDKVSRRIKCPTNECSNFFTLPLTVETVKCLKCKQTVGLTDGISQLQWCEEQYNEAFNVMDDGDTEKAANILKLAIDTFYRVALPPHRETLLAEEMLRICVADKGNIATVML